MINRLGIFGGAFDPVHKGHTQSLKFISELKIIDEFQVIPNYASPHKKDIKTSEKHRLKMLEIALKEFENIKLNNIELNNKTKSYTYETLKCLREIYPEKHLSLIIGLDSLYSFTTWKNWENILSLCSLLVLERQLNVSQALNKKLESKISSDFDDFFSSHGKILILKNDMINISSTDVRLKIKNNENLTGLVDEEVLKYILNESLYKI
jgi:nicotinate-nucleotide adenylyltransferase